MKHEKWLRKKCLIDLGWKEIKLWKSKKDFHKVISCEWLFWLIGTQMFWISNRCNKKGWVTLTFWDDRYIGG